MGDDQHELRVDGKGRVVIPKEMRESVGEPPYYIAEMDDDEITLTPARVVPASGE